MIELVLNNQIVSTDLLVGYPLVDFIRKNKRLTGTKIGCREGDCGACTVLVGDLKDGKINYITMTSCITPLGNIAGKHVVTIEGLNLKELTPIQEAFVHENGTQCGFCTPGFVVSLVGLALSDKKISKENLIDAIGGNICRCTGYKSIERAAMKIENDLSKIDKKNKIQWLVKNRFLPEYFLEIPNLIKKVQPLSSSDDVNGIIIGGGTDLLVQELEETREAKLKPIYDLSKLKGITIENGLCHVGAATTVSELMESNEFLNIFKNMKDDLKLISSTQIRNMATVAGNFANGSPIGDLSVIFMALDSVLVLSKNGKKRELPLREFFLGYKKVNKEPDELIEKLYFKILNGDTHFHFEKIGKRIHLDMATVNSALRLEVKDGVIFDAYYAVGGLGATIRDMVKTRAFLKGKNITNDTFVEANKIAQSEITPRSRAEYKRLLVRQQLFLHMKSVPNSSITMEALI